MPFVKTNRAKFIFLPLLLLSAAAIAFFVLWSQRGGQNVSSGFLEKEGVYNVQMHGAKGDGTTDDTEAIRSVIDYVQSAGGGIVFFPAGKYKVSSTLLLSGNNVELRGAGKASVIFMDKSDGTVIKIGNENEMMHTTHNKVTNLTIDRAVPPDPDIEGRISYGIHVERARFTTLDGVIVYNAAYGIGVGEKGGDGFPNQFTNIVNSYVMYSGSMQPVSTFPGANIVFWSGADYKVNTTFVEPTHVGILMTGNANGININETTVINGAPYKKGIVSIGKGFARYISNSIIENALEEQIYIGEGSQRVTVSDSWIGAGSRNDKNDRAGIVIEDTTQKVTIANNRIGDQRKQAILSAGFNVIIQGNTIEENVNSGCACDSVEITGGDYVIVSDNRVFGSLDRYGIHVSGNTDYYTITGNVSPEAGVHAAAAGKNAIVKDNL
ncbi:hypothetical protein PAT3040_02343 [Paenibacillus agaridevorans]|uniref:Pectate lyase superfamily protein domain-containing protein n=1 Tax=Paenibacillus agaridevorans TaxID=171404 RepID=A0A2R5EMC0_9BACL|nr:right-handed parallel beta-helix repeat-containing protein [Paenibacillus agaridevorans]GBG07782.1 hypothetical protein PAT3040_02343 [Paenibacillus agaridevorans]